MDLDQAMEKILELSDKNKELTDQLDSYEIKRQDYESKLEDNAKEINRLRELNMKYFTRLTMEHEEVEQPQEKEEQQPIEAPSFDDLLKDWRI